MSVQFPDRDFAAGEAAERAAPTTFRHARRGGTYTLLGAATLQTDVPLTDDAALVVYRAEDGRLWARPPAEFHDGRFVPVTQEPAGDIALAAPSRLRGEPPDAGRARIAHPVLEHEGDEPVTDITTTSAPVTWEEWRDALIEIIADGVYAGATLDTVRAVSPGVIAETCLRAAMMLRTGVRASDPFSPEASRDLVYSAAWHTVFESLTCIEGAPWTVSDAEQVDPMTWYAIGVVDAVAAPFRLPREPRGERLPADLIDALRAFLDARYELRQAFDDYMEPEADQVSLEPVSPEGITSDMLRNVAGALIAHCRCSDFLRSLLAEHGAKNISSLPLDRYAAVLAALRAEAARLGVPEATASEGGVA